MKNVDENGFIWLNGELVPYREANVHILTHTLHYGIGVFEGLRAYKTDKGEAIFCLSEHMQRFIDSAYTLNLSIPYDLVQLCQAVITVVQKNQVENKYIRPLCYVESDHLGVSGKFNVRVAIAVCGCGCGSASGTPGASQSGQRLQTSAFQRISPQTAITRSKAVGHYLNSYLAAQEAKHSGYDGALLLDNQGVIAECSTANFFMIKNGVVYSPYETSILPGITRYSIMQFCRDLNIPVEETNITRGRAYLADEVFLTGTVAEVTPVAEIDGRKIGKGCPGPITQQLQKLYYDTVHGRQPDYEDWLTYV